MFFEKADFTALSFGHRRLSQHELMPRIVQFVLVAFAYFITGKLGLQFAFLNDSASAIWPASGLALALLLIRGLRLWPAIFVGAFFVNITVAGDVVSSLLIASGNTLESVVGASLVCRYANGRHAFERAGDVVKLWFLACMAATLFSATIGVTSLCLIGDVEWTSFGPLWRTWWLGDAVGAFIAAALILLWTRDPRVEGSRHRVLETCVVLTAVAVFSLLVFHSWALNRAFYVLPLLLWAAFRLGRRETAGAILLLGIIGAWGTLTGRGPFVNELTAPNEALLLFQSFLAVMAVTNLTVAAVVAKRQQGVAKLRAAHDELEQRVHTRTVMLTNANSALREEITERRLAEDRFRRLLESAPDAMVIVHVSGKIDMVNSQAERMFGYPRHEMLGRTVDMLVPERKCEEYRAYRSAYMDDPHPRSMGKEFELHGLRRDGTEFPVEIALSPIEIEGQLVICAGIRDQTEKNALEARLMAAERERGDAMRDMAAFVQGAQEEERQRVSRELHDDFGQRLAALKMNMQLFEQEVSHKSDPYRTRLRSLVTDVDRMIAEVRRLSYNLRPLVLDDFGLTVALEMLCKEFERLYTVKTTLEVGESLPAFRDPQVDIALYRIAQGALANVATHADARHVSIRLADGDASVKLSVEDDGRGFDATSPGRKRDGRSGLGLVGMRERSELLGGSFHIQAKVGEGTKVEVRIPVSSGGDEPPAHS